MTGSLPRLCEKCGVEKTPVRSKAGKPGSGYRCRPCWAAYMRAFNQRPEMVEKRKARDKAYHRANRESRRADQLRTSFGITKADYDALLSAQGGGCATCGITQNTQGKANLSVDHCHDSGVVRGLLCNSCNLAIGLVKDDPERLRAMARYLEASQRPKLAVAA